MMSGADRDDDGLRAVGPNGAVVLGFMSAIEGGRPGALEGVRVVVERLRARQPEITRAIYDRVREAVPDTASGQDLVYQEGVLGAVDAVLSYSLDAIEHGPGWSGPIPVAAAVQARRAARAGVGLGAVLRRYVVGHGRLGEFVAEETARLASDAPELQLISRTHDALLEQFTAAIEREHNRACQWMVRSPEQRRLELVRRLLDSGTVGRAELAGLGYPLDGWHVGVIVVGEGARKALGGLKTDQRLLLAVPDGDEAMWAWLGGGRRLTHAEMERLGLDEEMAGLWLGVGEPARGLDGWRQTHRQAQQALRVALQAREMRVRYADVAVLLPWIEDPERGRALVDLYLSGLQSQKDGGAALRRTLRVYLEAGCNASLAARKLGRDRRTVTDRLATIETCLGYELDRHRADLEIVLRLHDLLNAQKMYSSVQDRSVELPTLV